MSYGRSAEVHLPSVRKFSEVDPLSAGKWSHPANTCKVSMTSRCGLSWTGSLLLSIYFFSIEYY